MIKDGIVIKTDDIDTVVKTYESNFSVFANSINANETAIWKLTKDVDKLMKKSRFRASKVGLFVAVCAGIVYIIKNEKDKDDMRFDILRQDKNNRFENEAERHESEEDNESTFI